MPPEQRAMVEKMMGGAGKTPAASPSQEGTDPHPTAAPPASSSSQEPNSINRARNVEVDLARDHPTPTVRSAQQPADN